jgi:hypothetical protein
MPLSAWFHPVQASFSSNSRIPARSKTSLSLILSVQPEAMGFKPVQSTGFEDPNRPNPTSAQLSMPVVNSDSNHSTRSSGLDPGNLFSGQTDA